MSAPIETPATRVCRACQQTKPLTSEHFSPKSHYALDLEYEPQFRARCRTCLTAAAREKYRQTHDSRSARANLRSMGIGERKRLSDPDRVVKKICTECCDLSWQRPASGCRTCREPYADEAKLDVCDYSRRYWNRELV